MIRTIAGAALSGVAMFISMGLGGALTPGLYWLVALLAPVPLLWLAFAPEQDGWNKGWVVFLAALAAGLIGGCNILPAYIGFLPVLALVVGVLAPALALALSVAGARFVAQRIAPITGVVAFAVLWTGFDYLLAQGENGAASSPAYGVMDLPLLIQSASVFGLWGVTLVLGLFTAAAGMFAATRKPVFALLALAVLLADGGYGQWRLMNAESGPVARVGLAAANGLVAKGLKGDEAGTLSVVKAYAEAGRILAQQNADLIVFPEKIAVLKPAWRGAVNTEFETLAHIGHTTVVAGFDEQAGSRQNNALVYFANGAAPQTYTKRRLVPGLERVFAPGLKSFMVSDRTGVAICKDMDFPAMLRLDALVEPNLYAVPAWDFNADGVWHARLAIMRGVENGFAVARSANNGFLSLSDAYGRIIAVKEAGKDMTLLRGDLPRGPGQTLYASIGDSLAYISLAMSVLFLVVGFFAKPKSAKPE